MSLAHRDLQTKMNFLIVTSSLMLIIFCGIVCSKKAKYKNPRVETPLGTLEGSYETTPEGKIYEAYYGVPYADLITPKQRFEVAKPVKPWTGVLSAKKFGPSCMQYQYDPTNSGPPKVTGSEDCLYVNVFTPAERSKSGTGGQWTELLPVIIFFHGGSFQFGSSTDFQADYLLNEPVLLVTFNYRLQALGFLSTESEIVPGNMGLKDQVILMRWVKEYIRYFGGNPNRMTIIGYGAGASSVHLHYLTKLSKGLFQRGMSMSGTALNCWAQSKGNLDKAKKLATFLKCPSDDTRKMVECLKTLPAKDITRATVKLTAFVSTPPTPFGPVIEYGNSDFQFINQEPINSIINGEVQDLPWITTLVSAEALSSAALILVNATLIKQLNNDWEKIAPNLLDFIYTIPKANQNKVSRLIRKHYFGKSTIDGSKAKEIIRMIGDRWRYSVFEKAVKLQSLAMKSPVRASYFSYKGAITVVESLLGSKTNYGVANYDDLSYILDSYFNPRTTQRDRDMQKLMIKLWFTYATDGVPKVPVDYWPIIDGRKEGFKFLHIAGPDNVFSEEVRNFGDQYFWNSIPFRENIKTRKRKSSVLKT